MMDDFDKGKRKPTLKEKIGFVLVVMMSIAGMIWSIIILGESKIISTEWALRLVVDEAKRYSRISPVYRDRIIPVMVLVIYCKYAAFFVTFVSRNWKANVEWAKHHEMARIFVVFTMAIGIFYMTPLMFGYVYYVKTISDIPHGGAAEFSLGLFNNKGGPLFLFLFAGAAGYSMAEYLVRVIAKLRSYFET